MKKFLPALLLLLSFFTAAAGRISGLVTDINGTILPYSSILVKGTNKGTSANNEGKFFLYLEPGEYTIICQHVGYKKEEQKITVTAAGQTLNFKLSLQEYNLKDVVVKQGEDPAYEIIRNTIRKKKDYVDEVNAFTCQVYSKGILRLRDSPKKFMGQKIDFEDGDTGKKRILYLSETLADYSFQKPDKRKIEVISTKVSGEKNGYGLSTPVNLNFYENSISIGNNLNPRGFISPLSDNTFNFYRFRYEGAFTEDNMLINRIKVIPKRNYEPLFSGYINIIENSWRIYSVELLLTRQNQMQFLDTLKVEQLYLPVNEVWMIKTQVFYPAVKLFGFDAHGSFLNVYTGYNVEPAFKKKFFDNVFLKYDTGSNKKPLDYWEKVRPVPLMTDEAKDYVKKDSLEQVKKDPRYLDSLDRRSNKVSLQSALLGGMNFSRRSKKEFYTVNPALSWPSYNTVEGFVLNVGGNFNKRFSENGREAISISPNFRYGFNNHHFNAHVNVNYSFGKKYFNQFAVGFGKRVFQFNNSNPISPLLNTFWTLQRELNYMKIYEAWWARIRFAKSIGDGFSFNATVQYQDRMPLDNTTLAKWKDHPGREFTPNFPVELTSTQMPRHQALIASVSLSFQPGMKYIEFPDRKFAIGSKYPRFILGYTKGIRHLLGSDVDYDRWALTMADNFNFKLAGRFTYRIGTGGFISKNKLQIPDYIHFNGNLTVFAGNYLNTFQLASYYGNSSTASLYGVLHAEHHFNGFITNKIPFFKKLNWFLVGGSNAFYVNQFRNYIEVFGGMENIFKFMRVDFIWGYSANVSKPVYGVRIGFTNIINNQGGGD